MSLLEELGRSSATIGGAFVGFGVVGTVIQVCFTSADDHRVASGLDNWVNWIRQNWKYDSWARAESDAFIELLDEVAGSKLWCWQRWEFSIFLVLGALALALVWEGGITILGALSGTLFWKYDPGFFVMISMPVVLAPAIAVSISLTRWIAGVVTVVARGGFTSLAAFATLFGIHLLLFMYWAPVVGALTTILHYTWTSLLIEIHSLFGIGTPNPHGTFVQRLEKILDLFWTSNLNPKFKRETGTGLGFTIIETTKRLLDWLTNGVRIAFAVTFAGSYIAPHVIRTPILNAWSWATKKPERPLLGLVLGALAGAVTFLFEVGRWLLMGWQGLLTLI